MVKASRGGEAPRRRPKSPGPVAMAPIRVFVKDASDKPIEAVVRPTIEEDMLLWAAQWVPSMSADAADTKWTWSSELARARQEPHHYACYSLLVNDELQGLRLLEISEDDVEQHGTHAVLLSSAPWNRPATGAPRYKGVGKVLVAVAIMQSQQDGHGGKTHCASKPTAVSYHKKNGMISLNLKDEDGFERFRFTAEAAAAFLAAVRKEGLLP